MNPHTHHTMNLYSRDLLRIIYTAVFAFGFLAACNAEQSLNNSNRSECEGETRATPFALNLRAQFGDSTRYAILKNTSPNPPDRGVNQWTLELEEDSVRAVIERSWSIKPWMPDHGHGVVPNRVKTSTQSDGSLKTDDFDLIMRGYWEFTIFEDPQNEGALENQAVFKFCLQG